MSTQQNISSCFLSAFVLFMSAVIDARMRLLQIDQPTYFTVHVMPHVSVAPLDGVLTPSERY